MELLSYVIIGVLLVSIWHFVYEGIIVPSILFHLRNDLFLLRDNIRKILIQDLLNDQEKETALFVHDGISLFIHKLPTLRIKNFYAAKKEIDNNIELKREIDSRINAIQNIKHNEVRDIFTKTNKIIRSTVLCNSGALMPFLLLTIVPLVIGIAMASELNRFVSEILAIPPRKARAFGL